MKITICSLFPDYFSSPLACSILARAQKFGKLSINCLNYRDFAESTDRRVDDRPYGGGRGMLLKPQVLARTMRSIDDFEDAHCIYLSAAGRPLTAHHCRKLSLHRHLILICGHYEGIDQRAIDLFADEEISVGDFVLTSGCPAALSLIDAVARHLPGVLGHPDSAKFESFESGLLEAAQYTRPPVFEEKRVPDILRLGNHQKIDAWKRDCSVEKTKSQRPDLFGKRQNGHQSSILCPSCDGSPVCPLSASWLVTDLEKSRKWFGEIWPFCIKSISNRSLTVGIDNCAFELVKRGCGAHQGNGLCSFSIDLSQNLSKLVWQCAQSAECEIFESKAPNRDQNDNPLFNGQISAVDPEGIKWHWNCSF